ncbi:DinB family protein [Nesterenkonia sp. PF2B19]|uniref:DinB family protein n=1 Tax=Nesterenkonia sp. PF2B19 TaxID=1881858 RepID=UPI000871DB27|nr:DinB family protein [Nesterenkonia sp. PF2B19]OSM44304.1 mini-circle protein [Nesterenkonia sp. PF2B19]
MTMEFTVDEQGRPEAPLAGGELETLLGFLEFHRATLAHKCAGLDAAGLAQRVEPSTMTLGGLFKHLALVEDHWFSVTLFAREPAEPWLSADWEADEDWEWHSAAADSPQELRALWERSVEASRRLTQQALNDGGLERSADRARPDGAVVTLRFILVHAIEEYSRHNGHADLLRESIDGQRGE